MKQTNLLEDTNIGVSRGHDNWSNVSSFENSCQVLDLFMHCWVVDYRALIHLLAFLYQTNVCRKKIQKISVNIMETVNKAIKFLDVWCAIDF